MSVTVYLVGAGPGDTGLITVRGRELLAAADVIVYDYLANPELLDCAPASAERVYVGKKGYAQHLTQDELNVVLIDAARALEKRGGGTVVRLKGGDPFVFGRGGEEALALAAAGIDFEVVPGVTSGIAAAAFAGIPVTHRGIASSLTFVTGHEDPSKTTSALDWNALAALVGHGGTVCFYMGMRELSSIAHKLMQEGAAADTSAVIIHRGTSPRQHTLVTTLQDVAADVSRAGLAAPSIILVGEVARLRERLAWFEKRPLFGKRIVVTRSRTQAGALASRLTALGADVMEFPTIEIVPPVQYAPLDEALAQIDSYAWVVLTSVNGVDAFFERLKGDARRLGHALVAAIGPATAERLRQHGIVADTVPAEYRGEAVFSAIEQATRARGLRLEGARVLIPRAAEARAVLPDMLRSAGATVDVVSAYRTVRPADTDTRALIAELESGRIDAMSFTSSSTAKNLFELLGDASSLLDGVALCSIGPITSATLRSLGHEPAIQASEYTIDGLVEAICKLCGTARQESGPEKENGR